MNLCIFISNIFIGEYSFLGRGSGSLRDHWLPRQWEGTGPMVRPVHPSKLRLVEYLLLSLLTLLTPYNCAGPGPFMSLPRLPHALISHFCIEILDLLPLRSFKTVILSVNCRYVFTLYWTAH